MQQMSAFSAERVAMHPPQMTLEGHVIKISPKNNCFRQKLNEKPES